MDIQTVGVTGAGRMGRGIAQVFALAGCRVLLQDLSPEALHQATAAIAQGLGKQAQKGRIRETEAEAALLRIQTTVALGDFKDADFVVKAGVVPFVDLAYQGFGDGLEADAAGVRHMAAAVPEMLLAVSCSKNFGLYRDRVGAAFTISETPERAALLLTTPSPFPAAPRIWQMSVISASPPTAPPFP